LTRPQLEQDTLYEFAFFHAKIGMAVVGLDGRFQKVNPSLCKLTGYSESELVKMTFMDITHPDDAPVGERMRAMLIAGTMDDYQNEKRYIRKDGVHVWVEISVTVVRDEAGVPSVFVTQLQDISARKRAEHMLQRHMQQYKSLFDKHPDIVYAVSMDGEVTSLNDSVERITGFTAAEWRGQVPSLLGDGIRHALEHADEGSLSTFRQETAVPHKNGSTVHLSVMHAPIIVDGEAVGIYGIARDITKRTTLIRQLKESERKYRLLAENSLDVIARINPFGILTYVSPSSEALLGFTPEELVGIDFASLLHPEDAQKRAIPYAGAGRLSDERLSTFRCRTKSGEYVWIESRTKSIRGKHSGKVTEYVTVLRDVTEREAERRRLREAEELYRLISDNAREVIMICEPDGIVRYVSPAVAKVLGYEPEEIVGRMASDWFHGEDVAALRSRTFNDEDVFRNRVLHKNGTYIWFETSMKRIRNERGEVATLLGIGRDITERMKTEELLQQSEKLSAAGQLAAGIAHEIRNPLTSLKGFLQLMQNGAAAKPDYFRILNDELTRIETILSELLILAKPHSTVTAARDLSGIVRSVVALLESQANLRNVELRLRLPKEPLPINGDDNQLKQVFVNFVKNAIEAMPDGGAVDIQAEPEDGNAVLRFIDNGHGIPEEKLPFVGRPFFTTKEYGTGLGLSVSYKIIAAHNGTVSVRSVVGEGTEFAISLPLVPV